MWSLIGGLEEIRTPDPRNANAMRSQLRYKPKDIMIISTGNLIVNNENLRVSIADPEKYSLIYAVNTKDTRLIQVRPHISAD